MLNGIACRILGGGFFAYMLLTLATGGGASAATLQLQQLFDPAESVTPVHATSAPGDSSRLFVAELATGNIRVYDKTTKTLLATPFLTIPDIGSEGEQGLFAVAFSPDYQSTGKFYVSYADASGNHRIVEYTTSVADPNLANAASARPIMTIEHPDDGAPSHYAGWIGFGPNDGNLYISTGDSNANPINGVSQDTSNLLGSILRINPAGDDFLTDPARNYSVPGDNPFVGEAGSDEIYAYGLRNPWRPGFDSETGDFFIADVGEDRIEEINFGAAGANYGWPGFEGSESFLPGLLSVPPGEVTFPIYEYTHGDGPFEGRSVTGGGVYRGPIDVLDGAYFYGDFRDGRVWSFEYDPNTDMISNLIAWDLQFDLDEIARLVSFGFDADGNMYLIDIRGSVYLVADAIIPLPAALFLMLTGVAALSGAARKRKIGNK